MSLSVGCALGVQGRCRASGQLVVQPWQAWLRHGWLPIHGFELWVVPAADLHLATNAALMQRHTDSLLAIAILEAPACARAPF